MEGIVEILKRYRYGILILVIGIGLMLLPSTDPAKQEAVPVQTEDADTFTDALEQILCQIDGAGRVRVMLTQAEGETTVYQKNTDQSGDSFREDTVILSTDARQEQGLVRQVIPPRYRGCLVVCQGADRASVRLAVVDAVSALTGLSSNQITVLKMK